MRSVRRDIHGTAECQRRSLIPAVLAAGAIVLASLFLTACGNGGNPALNAPASTSVPASASVSSSDASIGGDSVCPLQRAAHFALFWLRFGSAQSAGRKPCALG
jgi:hypothetical protein